MGMKLGLTTTTYVYENIEKACAKKKKKKVECMGPRQLLQRPPSLTSLPLPSPPSTYYQH